MKIRTQRILAAVLAVSMVFVLSARSATAETVVLGDSTTWNYPTALPGLIDDTWIYWNTGNQGPGTAVQFQKGEWVKHVLYRFDIAGAGIPIGPNTVIDSAVLDLADSGGTHPVQPDIEVYYVTKPWVEAEVTWYDYAAGQPWETAGAIGPTDIEPGPAAMIIALPAAGSYARFDIVEFKPLIQGWANGQTNYGLMMKYADEALPTAGMNFGSSEWLAHVMPYMTIEYHVETVAIPEPAGLGLIGLALLGLRKRRS